MTHSGQSGSGSINGFGFVNRAVSITAIGSTLDRPSFVEGFFIDHTAASINISGVGMFTFITPTRTFANSPSAGFSRAGVNGSPELTTFALVGVAIVLLGAGHRVRERERGAARA